jgi:CheY-like chemotaxis protein
MWPTYNPDSTATLILALAYSSVRYIQYRSDGLAGSYFLRRATIVFDQLFLGLVILSGGQDILLTPLSLLLIIGANSYSTGYSWLAAISAFLMRLSLAYLSPTIFMDAGQIVLLSLFLATPVFLSTRNRYVNKSFQAETDSTESLPTLESSFSDHDEEPTPFSGAPVERKVQRILILSNNPNNTTLLSQQLSEWGHETTTCGNSLQAFKHMLSRRQGEVFAPYSFLIVDGESLDIEPLSLVRLVNEEPMFSDLRLICIQPSFYNEKYAQRLLRAGYHTLLESPWSKEQLFSIISYEQGQITHSCNVISLAKRRHIKQAYTRQKQILIADTPTEERTSLSNALTLAGYNIRIVDNGDQALDALEEHFFDLAIINMDLPIMSGIQVVKFHRFTTPYKHWVPFIFISEESNPEALSQSQSIGVDICLFKPISPYEVMLSILAALDKGDLQNLTYVSRNTDPIQFKDNSIQDAMLLDHVTLLRLEKLDNGITFINELFKIFEAEGRVILSHMEQAVSRQQLGQFLDQAQILLDSAGQLGALVLYELSQQASRLSAREFEYKGSDLLCEIEQTFNLTLQAYAYYLSQRTAALNSEEPIKPAT